MAERYQKSIKVTGSLENAFQVCKNICTNNKMTIKDSRCDKTSFYIFASEKTNWLSTSWPTRVEINGQMLNDRIIIEVAADSSMGSLTQANANSKKLDGIVDSIKEYLE